MPTALCSSTFLRSCVCVCLNNFNRMCYNVNGKFVSLVFGQFQLRSKHSIWMCMLSKLRHFSISNAWAGNCPPPLLIVRLFIVPFTIKRILKWLHSIISLECRYFAGVSDNFEYNYIIAWCFLSSRNNHTATSKHYVDKINARFETDTKKNERKFFESIQIAYRNLFMNVFNDADHWF